MNRKTLASILIALAMAACGGDDKDNGGDDSGTPAGGDTYVYVVSQLDLGSVNDATTPPTAPGFNLDSSTENACGDGAIVDYQSGAPDNEQGVDNQLISVAGGLSSQIDIASLLSDSVLDGDVLLLFEVSGVDSLTNDDSVSFKVFLGEVPGSGEGDAAIKPGSSGGALTANQTFDYHTTAVVSGVTGSITNGRLTVSASSLPLAIPALGKELNLNLQNTQARFDITATTLSNGVIGGKVSVQSVLDEVADLAPDYAAVAETVLPTFADLDKTGDACTSISAAIKFSGVKATKGDAL